MEAAEDGDHRLCFDNSHSKMSQKMIFFVVTVNSESVAAAVGGGPDTWADVALMDPNEMEQPAAAIRVRRRGGAVLRGAWSPTGDRPCCLCLQAQMDLVYQNLEKSRQVLAALRAFEARDRYLLEDNLWRVSFWSCLNLLVMSAVAVTQIYTLRRLFHDKRPVRT